MLFQSNNLHIIISDIYIIFGLPTGVGSVGKESAYNAGDACKCKFNPRVRKIPWRRAWQPTPVFLLGESHGQRSLVSYSPRGHKELDTTEATEHTHTHTHRPILCNYECLYLGYYV